MLDFVYYTPTKVYFGKDTHKNIGEIIAGYGYKKIMMQYGKNSIKKSGLYDEVITSLKNNSIEVVEMGGVEPNPKVSFVRDAVEIAKKENVEFILAVGGGSVIDSSKATALGAKSDCDVWDFFTGKETPQDAIPVGCILTHSAAGSEMSGSAVLTNIDINMKRGVTCELNRCKFAICNPCLTYTVSKYQTACGIVDIMAHTMERYFTPLPDTDLTDQLAESILRAVISASYNVMENPEDYDARATIMWASSISHNGLTGCGRVNALPVHQLEHALSGEYDNIPHGAGLAILFPAWAKYIYKKNISRFARFARNVWQVNETDDEKAAVCGIKEMEKFFDAICMPLSVKEFDISNDCFDKLANLCTFNKQRTIKSYIDMDFDDIKNIFEIAY